MLFFYGKSTTLMLGNHYRLKLTVAITGDRDDSFSVFGLNLLGITAIYPKNSVMANSGIFSIKS